MAPVAAAAVAEGAAFAAPEIEEGAALAAPMLEKGAGVVASSVEQGASAAVQGVGNVASSAVQGVEKGASAIGNEAKGFGQDVFGNLSLKQRWNALDDPAKVSTLLAAGTIASALIPKPEESLTTKPAQTSADEHPVGDQGTEPTSEVTGSGRWGRHVSFSSRDRALGGGLTVGAQHMFLRTDDRVIIGLSTAIIVLIIIVLGYMLAKKKWAPTGPFTPYGAGVFLGAAAGGLGAIALAAVI